jgi:D-alanine-D-alanine ligase
MKTLFILYEVAGNPYFSSSNKSEWLTDYTRPTEVNDLIKLLNKLGIHTEIIDGVKGLQEKQELILSGNNLVLNLGRGIKSGVERKLMPASMCDYLSIPYIGSGAYALGLNRNKYHSNCIASAAGIPTPKSQIVGEKEAFELNSQLSFPLIVKPNVESNSIGIDDTSIFVNNKGLKDRVEWVQQRFQQEALVEEFISGDEISVAIIGNKESAKVVGYALNLLDGKSLKGKVISRLANINREVSTEFLHDKSLQEVLSEYALKAHKVLNARDYSRVDFRLDNSGHPIFIEIELQPDLGIDSTFLSVALYSFEKPEAVLLELIETALSRINKAADIKYNKEKGAVNV